MTGTVESLWRYPVKSMLGESVAGSRVTERGLTGDRRLALVDRESGKVVSAKKPRLWRDMLTLRAVLEEAGGGLAVGGLGYAGSAAGHPTLRITDAKGGTVWTGPAKGGDPALDEALSGVLGRPVTLVDTPPPDAELERSDPDSVLREGLDAEVPARQVRFGSGAPPGGFHDFAPLHLVTVQSLARLAELNPTGRARLERYRPNIVIAADAPADAGFVENAWLGRELVIGEAVVKVIAATPRCAVPTLAHGPLPRDTEALRVPARHNRIPALPGRDPEPCVGVYAQVVAGGMVRVGDAVRF
jgi:uncharacterized protein